MATKYLNKYRNETIRSKNHDYGSNASYFITINTSNRQNFFGIIGRTDDCPSTNEIDVLIRTDNRPSLRPSQIGKIADEYWKQIPQHYPWVKLDAYVIMPNHLHGIIIVNKTEIINEWKPNVFGKQSKNLGSVIRAFKSSVKRYANLHDLEFAWQSGYFDTFINNDHELHNVRNYIHQNPSNWLKKYQNNH